MSMSDENKHRIEQMGKVMQNMQEQLYIFHKMLEEAVLVNESLEFRAMGGVYVDFDLFDDIMKVIKVCRDKNIVSQEFYDEMSELHDNGKKESEQIQKIRNIDYQQIMEDAKKASENKTDPKKIIEDIIKAAKEKYGEDVNVEILELDPKEFLEKVLGSKGGLEELINNLTGGKFNGQTPKKPEKKREFSKEEGSKVIKPNFGKSNDDDKLN